MIPSIPGFGLSGPTSEPGWSAGRVAGAFAELTSWLGYDRYGAQGGDEGAIISPDLGRAAPAAIISPAALSIVTSLSADGAERNRALGAWGAVAGSAGAAGVRHVVDGQPAAGGRWGSLRVAVSWPLASRLAYRE